MIDVELIVRRRHELGLSQRQVARQLGTSPMTVIAIEGGTNHDDLPLRLICRLADILILDVIDLFVRPALAEPPADAGSLAEVGALLASAEGGVTLDALAEATGCTLDVVDDLVEEFDRRLRQLGMQLRRRGGRLQIVPRHDVRPDGRLQQLLRGQHVRHGMTATDATLLHRALRGGIDAGELTNAEQVAYARLLNAGLIDTSGCPTEDVAFSLALASTAP